MQWLQTLNANNCAFFSKKSAKIWQKSKRFQGQRRGQGRGNPNKSRPRGPKPRTPTPNPGQKKRPSPEEPDPESPMCCYLLVFADDLLPDNVGVHIDNLLWVSQVCRHFSEVVFLVLLDGADDVKGF